jgi:hypothetical protein
MSIFPGWKNHTERLRFNWNQAVGENDTAVIAGDISWGMSLGESLADFLWIDRELNGSKIIMKGNHDYWWNTVTKIQAFFAEHSIGSIRLLFNNSYEVEGVSVCGTRGYIGEDEKLLRREAGRLEMSICSAVSGKPIVFTHYPPEEALTEVLQRYEIDRVYSGHIHSSDVSRALIGEKHGIMFDIISADYLGFAPKKIL